MLDEGIKAPEIVLNDKDGKEVKLSDFSGKKVVVYFYPKDNTPGCTRQACAFANAFDEYEKLGVTVIGISRDSEESHVKFAEKYNLPFLLLADPLLNVIKDYDVWQEKKMYGKVSMGVVRSTYLIDEKGVIEKVWKKAKPDTNAEEILEYIKENL
jgi:peroxiredoxin Q/BCP